VNLTRTCSLGHKAGKDHGRRVLADGIEEFVATFVVLVSWTEQGIKTYPETVQRADAFAGILRKLGGRVVSLVWTIGPYDIVTTVEAPDAETITAGLLRVGALGNIRSTTLRAFSREEMQGIVAKAQSV
jgi:uncharacterized protein with GYD domain